MSKHTTWLEHYVAIQKAIDDGFEVVWSDSKSLLLDLDSTEAIANYEEKIKSLKWPKVSGKKISWQSKSGEGHLHVKVTLDEPIENPLARIILEMYLGSDPARGLCQLCDHLTPANASVLFKPKPIKQSMGKDE